MQKAEVNTPAFCYFMDCQQALTECSHIAAYKLDSPFSAAV